MKKRLLIIELVLMYLMQLPFDLGLIMVRVSSIPFNVIGALIAISIITFLLLIPISVIIAILGVAYGFNEDGSVLKLAMNVKIALIPWYIINVLFAITVMAGTLNPWLFLAAPFIVCLLIGLTYVLMLSTSIPSLVEVIKRLRDKKISMSARVFIPVAMHFFFCVDILGSEILYINLDKKSGV